jgi:anaerobic selenocysteine-containing dehydrogenase/Fe-S-cluster-containing dehydrogenase component
MAKGMERREFLKVVGAAGVGAGLAGCNPNPPDHLLPYVAPSEDIVPGIATWYRTTCRECPAGCGMEVRTREGRAVKVEGSELSPISHGRLCARGQASLQGLYDPDRVPQALQRSGQGWQEVTWDAAEQRLTQAVSGAHGKGVFLTRSFTGTLDQLIDDWCAAAGFQRVIFDGYDHEALRAANRMLFGIDGVPVHDFSNADVVVSFGADFLETWLSPVDYAHGFVQGHAYHAGVRGHHIAVSSHQSLTDQNADEWLPVRPGTEHVVALAIARLVADSAGGATGAVGQLLAGVDVNATAEAAGVPTARLRAVADAFARNGRSLAVGPGVAVQHSAATDIAAAVAVLNWVAGNVGTTVRFDRLEHPGPTGGYAQLQQLMQRMQAGQVDVLLVYGPDPIHAMPEREAFVAAMGKVSLVASFSPYLDDTSAHAHLLLPDHHFLESWGDMEPRTGIHTLVQPVMEPVFKTKQSADVLLSVASRAQLKMQNPATTFYDYLRQRWTRDIFPKSGAKVGFEDWWHGSLEQATVVLDATAAVAPKLNDAAVSQIGTVPARLASASGGVAYALVVYPSYRFYDGRTANRPWLQELPDPVSKISWEGWVEIHPNVADRLGLDLGSGVEVTTPHGSVTLPAFPYPGIREDAIALQLGQGHEAFGRYAEHRGANPVTLLAPVQDTRSGALAYLQTQATLRPTGEWMRVPNTAGRDTQDGREIIQRLSIRDARAADVAAGLTVMGALPAGQAGRESVAAGTEQAAGQVSELQGSAGFKPITFGDKPQDYPPPETYYGEYTAKQPRWAMAIDLERCIGCSACVTACYAENNVGMVGPELIANGRIMAWMRIERYFEETEAGELKGTGFLPMLCQQCGNAPCEPVCPVYASYHTPDGLNGQVYNRCVGTRYCANNCPYKVRVFNWFSWEWPEPLNWQLNPDVVPREKGVMEKCTFCVQRIQHAQHEARLDGRTVRDGEITPACAQTCPGDAIVFGNIKDPNSRVARIAASGRGYRVLEELNTQSAVTYLKRVTTEPTET